MDLPVDKQYKGTDSDAYITTPGPVRRTLNKTQEGTDSILGKDDEPRPGKVSEAGLMAIKTAAVTPVIGSVKPHVLPGGGRLYVHRATGQAVLRNPANASQFYKPMQGTADHLALTQHVKSLPGNMLMGMRQNAGQSFLGRMGTKLLNHATTPMGGLALGLGVPLALNMIPAGKDEYGNSRSLAQTGIGSALGMAAGLAPHIAPGIQQRMTAPVQSQLLGLNKNPAQAKVAPPITKLGSAGVDTIKNTAKISYSDN